MLELPKNLKPNTHIFIFKLKNIIQALVFLALMLPLVSNLNITGTLNATINVALVLTALLILLFEKDGRDFVTLFKDNIVFMIDSKYLVYTKKKVKQDDKRFKVSVDKTIAEMRSDMLKCLKIETIDEDLTIQATDNYYYKYLEVQINTHPRYESVDGKSNSIKAFNKLIVELSKNSNGKLFTINTPIVNAEYEASLEKYKVDKEYYNLKKFQLGKAKSFFDLRYFIEIRDKDIETLNITEKSLISTFSKNVNVKKIDDDNFKKIMEDRLSNADVTIHADYIYNNSLEEYQCYLSLADFNTKQDYYFLRNVFASEYDVVMLHRKPKDISDNKTLNGSYAEYKSNDKFNKSFTNKIKNNIHSRQLLQLAVELEQSKGDLFSLDIIIKVVAKDLKTLKERKTKLKMALEGSVDLLDNTYIQKRKMLTYNKLGVDISDKYIIPDNKLAYGYPFNFVYLVQKGGLLKNVDRENLLILNTQLKNKIQKSFSMIIFGDKGSGKSTAIKEKALDDLFHYRSNVIMLDFDSETETMVNNFGGTFVDLSGVPFNIMRVNIDPVLETNNVSQHVVFVVECIKELYTDIDELYLNKVISQVYEDFKITNDTIFEAKTYPTISDVILKLQDDTSKRAIAILERLEDMDRNYSYLTRIDTHLRLDDKLMSISFNSIKSDVKLTNMVLYYLVTLIAKRSNQNHFSIKYFAHDDERMRKYLKYYMEMINDLDNFDRVSQMSRLEIKAYFKANAKMFSIIIDECSRTLKYPKLVDLLERIARDDRKYFTSLTFADQSTLTLKNIPEFEMIYSLMQYKMFFDLEERNKSFLNELSFLEQEVKEITGGEFEPGEGILKISKYTYKINSRIDNNTDELFEGRH